MDEPVLCAPLVIMCACVPANRNSLFYPIALVLKRGMVNYQLEF